MPTRNRKLIIGAAIAVAAAGSWWQWPAPPAVLPNSDAGTSSSKLLPATPEPEALANAGRTGSAQVSAPPAAPSPPIPSTTHAAPSHQVDEHLRRQVAEDMSRVYEDVGSALGLNDDEASRLISTLIAHRIGLLETPYEPDPVARKEGSTELQREQREELLGLLGPDRMAKLDTYDKSIGPRIAVQELTRAYADPPISEEQRHRLVLAAIHAGAGVDEQRYNESESPDALDQEYLAKLEQRDAKMLVAARTVLSEQQVLNIEAYMEAMRSSLQAAMNQRDRH